MNEYGRYPLQICITYLLKTPTLYDHSMTISDKMQKNSGFSNANCCTYLHFRHLFEDL